MDELRTLLLYLAAWLLLAGILCMWLGRLLARKTGRGWAAFLPLFGYILFLCLLGTWAVPRLEAMGDIVLAEKTVSPEQAALGMWMSRIGLFGFLVFAVLMRLADRKLKTFLWSRDAAVCGRIVPDRLALIFTLLPLGLLSVVLLGTAIGSGNGSVLLILVMGGGMMAAHLAKDQFTRLTLDGNTLTLRRLGRERQYQISDICDIRFRAYRGITGTMLVIVFRDGKSFCFPMDSFRGVQNTHNELKKRLKKEK